MFKIKKINDHTVYYSDILNIEHFFTTRSLVVKENLDLVKNYLKVKTLVKPKQVHSANVEIVKEGVSDYPDCDGLILDKKDIGIFLNFADCTPVILYDSKNNIASIVHAGWRGTAQKISTQAILKMKEIYNTNPIDIIAVIGPCISFNQFETYDEALKLLKQSVKDETGLFKDNFADLKGINKRQLVELGVKAQNIDISPHCTVLDNDKFFSYRKENKTNLRHSAVLKLS